MTITVGGTSITFSDGTTQSTAASTPTTLYAIGTNIIGRPQNTTSYAVNSTVAGSSLYACSTTSNWNSGGPWERAGSSGTNLVPTASLVNTGTWRALSPASSGFSGSQGYPAIWVRIS